MAYHSILQSTREYSAYYTMPNDHSSVFYGILGHTTAYFSTAHPATSHYSILQYRTIVYYRQHVMLHHNTAYYGIIGHFMTYYITHHATLLYSILRMLGHAIRKEEYHQS